MPSKPDTVLPALGDHKRQAWRIHGMPEQVHLVHVQPKRPFMLRTLPRRYFAELEELLPEALSNAIMVNGLECKMNNESSKVGFSIPDIPV